MNGISVCQGIANRAYDRDGAGAYQEMMEHLTSPLSCGQSRLDKAEEMLRQGRVRHMQGTPWYQVKGTRVYKVRAGNGSASCDCPDFARNKKPCKHVLAVAIVEQFVSDDNPDLHLREIARSLYGCKRRSRENREWLAGVLPPEIGQALVQGSPASSGNAMLADHPRGKSVLFKS